MDKLEKVKKVKWETVVSFKTEFLTECLAQRSFSKVEEKLGLPLSREVIIDNDICHDFNQLSVSRNIIRKNLKKVSQKIFSVIEKQSRLFIKESRFLASCGAENEKLLRNIKKWFSCYGDTVGLINVPGRLDEVLEKEIRDDLRKYGLEDPEKVFRTIAQAEKLSGTGKEKLELMKLVLSGSINNERTQRHAQKYRWISVTLLLGDLYDAKRAREKISQFREDKDLKNKIKDLENASGKSKNQLNALKKQYNFKPEILEKIKILRHAIWFRTARLDWLNEGCALIRPLFQKIAEKLGLTYEELIYCSPEEIIGALAKNKKIGDKKEIRERTKKYAMWTLDGKKYDYITGEKVDELKKALSQKNELTNKIKGIVAFEGKVDGPVRILKDRSEINKLKQGEILVTKLTTPDFVPAMEKAKAIITDLGGITSHAAIVSRELKIPCIVGTKIATQALKNGDLVEVDAEKGVVKILKRAA